MEEYTDKTWQGHYDCSKINDVLKKKLDIENVSR
jgi:hypothetical protein